MEIRGKKKTEKKGSAVMVVMGKGEGGEVGNRVKL